MLCHQISSLRKQAGMSQHQLARALNLSPSAIGMYEQGRRVPAVDTLVQMARLFDVSLDMLVTGIAGAPPQRGSPVECPCGSCCRRACEASDTPHPDG